MLNRSISRPRIRLFTHPKSEVDLTNPQSIHRRGDKTDQIRVGARSLRRRHANAVFSFGDNFDASGRGKAGEYGRVCAPPVGLFLPSFASRAHLVPLIQFAVAVEPLGEEAAWAQLRPM